MNERRALAFRSPGSIGGRRGAEACLLPSGRAVPARPASSRPIRPAAARRAHCRMSSRRDPGRAGRRSVRASLATERASARERGKVRPSSAKKAGSDEKNLKPPGPRTATPTTLRSASTAKRSDMTTPRFCNAPPRALAELPSRRILRKPAGGPAAIGRVVPPGEMPRAFAAAQPAARSGAGTRAVLLPGCSSKRLLIVPDIALPTWLRLRRVQAGGVPPGAGGRPARGVVGS